MHLRGGGLAEGKIGLRAPHLLAEQLQVEFMKQDNYNNREGVVIAVCAKAAYTTRHAFACISCESACRGCIERKHQE